MIPYSLTHKHRLQLARAFASVPRVDISIECALQNHMGKAFVDSVHNPQCFLIEQDEFFCYVAGDLDTDSGHEFLKSLSGGHLLMAGTQGWDDSVKAVFGERLRTITRYSYSSDQLSLDHLQALASANLHTPNVIKVDAALAGMNSPYLGIGAFDSPKDFVTRGIGFCMLKEDTIIGGAYSSLIADNAIEVSIVVDPAHHRQGIASALAAQLLLWCLEHEMSPHWDAANMESCHLAEKLGYNNKAQYTAYFLK